MATGKGYRHTQVGYVTMISIALAIMLELGVLLLILLLGGMSWFAFWFIMAVVVLLVALLCVFSTLTAIVDETCVTASFGPGLLKFSYPLQDIVSAKAVFNSWRYGYGVRLLKTGWLYNVSGLKAVEITLKSGRAHRIGTNEPEKLARAIRKGMKNRG